MRDFEFGSSMDSNETGYNQDPNEKGKIIKFLIVVVVAAIVGFSVYFITDALINGNRGSVTVTQPKDTQMEVTEEIITYLYDNVTYSVNGVRSSKFFKNGTVTKDDFTTEEKIYFALRYATAADFVDMSSEEVIEDDASTEEKKDEKKLRTFSIANDKIKTYVFNFFGEGVTYTVNTPVTIGVNFTVDGYNSGTMKYDSSSDTWLVVFDSVLEDNGSSLVNPYLYKIESALKEGRTSNIIIKEKVVFTALKQHTDASGKKIDKYDCGVYKDFAKTTQLEMKSGVTADELSLITFDNYKENTSTVTYTFFKDENDEYHFLSSEITSE